MPRRWIALVAFALPALAAASSIDYTTREVHLKCVYDGPVGVGTDENLRHIHEKAGSETKGKLVKTASTTGPAAVFLLPLGLGEIRGFKTRFQLYALAGGAPTAAERAQLMKDVDGIIFVAYADKARLKENIATFDALKGALATQGYDWRKVPLTVQLNRADAKGALTVDELRAALKLGAEVPIFPANSATGVGVFETLKSSAKQALTTLKTVPPKKL